MKRRILLAAIAASPAIALFGCSKNDSSSAQKTIKLGTLSGPHAEVAEEAKKVAAKKGLNVQIIEFSDYGQVNEALAAKDIDCNAFQHVPFLEKAKSSKGYQFTALGKTVLFPLGVYSQKIHTKTEIADGMLVSVPADPANLGRGLQPLKLRSALYPTGGVGIHATTHDIAENPKHLVFREVDSAYLGRSLPDVGFAVINGSWAVKSKLSPEEDAFILEGADSDLANVLGLCVRSALLALRLTGTIQRSIWTAVSNAVPVSVPGSVPSTLLSLRNCRGPAVCARLSPMF